MSVQHPHPCPLPSRERELNKLLKVNLFSSSPPLRGEVGEGVLILIFTWTLNNFRRFVL
jgi:hypothetical protein